MVAQCDKGTYGTFLPDVLDFKFRFNPVIKLVKHNALPLDQRAVFKGLAKDPEHFGFLLSDEIPEIGVQAVDRTAALLFNNLREAGDVRSYISDPCILIGLVLDGILQIECGGSYITGPVAYPLLFKEPLPDLNPDDPITAISIAALKLAQFLPSNDPRLISRWLYHYHALPISTNWARRLGTSHQVRDFLALHPNEQLSQLLADHFSYFQNSGWQTWKNLNWVEPISEVLPTYKLYISPHPKDLPQVFARVIQVFVKNDVFSFKLGSDASGLLRSDKLIAYFADFSSLESIAVILKKQLQDFTAHGVPFTAAFTRDGLLSWGLDPPRQEQIPGWQGVQSWRFWVTNRLARAIVRARSLSNGPIEPWRFALLRLQIDGIDTRRWLPSNAYWV